MRRLVPTYIEALRPYEAGLQADRVRREYGVDRIIKLGSNENPLGPSPRAVEAMGRVLSGSHRYPDGGEELRRVLAGRYHAKLGNVIAGSGSESILANIIRTFLCDDDEVLTTEAAFVGFQVLARSRGVRYRTVPYRNRAYDLTALAAAINDSTKIIYLANPNNPTGTIFTGSEFDEFYRRVPPHVLIILDEAYFEYAQDDPAYPDSMRYRYDNVITLRTFSKAYGLAGLRIGYALAHEELISNLLKVKLPFEPSSVAAAAGIAALSDTGFLDETLNRNRRALRMLTGGLAELGIEVVPSHANFVMAVLDSERQAQALVEALLRQGIIIRPLAGFGLPGCVRISTGMEEDMERTVEAVQREVAICRQ